MMKLNAKALGLSLGILWGISIFLVTLFVMWRGGGATLSKLSQFYIGYSVSFVGAVLGLIWGFVDGLISGVLFAALYNALSGKEQ